jgi:hypothetical protein
VFSRIVRHDDAVEVRASAEAFFHAKEGPQGGMPLAARNILFGMNLHSSVSVLFLRPFRANAGKSVAIGPIAVG